MSSSTLIAVRDIYAGPPFRPSCSTPIPPDTICNHSMRGTGITTYLEGGGQLEYAQWMAAHADVRTTKLYDRRQLRITQDEVERISYW